MTIENIDAATLRKWQEADKAVIVDVREPTEYDAEHIEGAALVPLGRLRRAALPEHSGRKLVVMCRMGGRGQAACQRLRAEMSPQETIYHLEGGLVAWNILLLTPLDVVVAVWTWSSLRRSPAIA